MSKNPAGKNRESVPVKDNFELEVLQAQYKELKEKVSDLICGFVVNSFTYARVIKHCSIKYVNILKQEFRFTPMKWGKAGERKAEN